MQPSPTAASESSPSPTNSTFAATARAAIERANAARAPATARAPAKSKIGMKKQDNSKIALKPVREKIVKLNDPPKGKRKRGAAVIEPPQADADADTHEDKKTKVDDEGSSGKDDSDEGSSGKDDSDEDA